ncbi:hypothetical protein VNO80_22954 [Phaseolus coccineus]|uniref:Uncharacterized protein n=1 Tax=Phaseolus coccineus TaxID=3886 RepID=A0AAN9M8Y8_PHACN
MVMWVLSPTSSTTSSSCRPNSTTPRSDSPLTSNPTPFSFLLRRCNLSFPFSLSFDHFHSSTASTFSLFPFKTAPPPPHQDLFALTDDGASASHSSHTAFNHLVVLSPTLTTAT